MGKIKFDLTKINLTPGVTHTLAMKLSDDELTRKDSYLSNSINFISNIEQLATPIIYYKAGSDNKVIQWQEVPGAIRYDIYIDNNKVGEVM